MQTRIAAAVIPIINDNTQAIGVIERYVEQAHNRNCKLIIFPEAIIGGIDLCGAFSEDKTLAMEAHGSSMELISNLAVKHGIWIGIGFLELHEDVLYDAYLVLNDQGKTALHYRRMSRTWLATNNISTHYACGDRLPVADTPWGRIGVLLCGDLFNEDIRNSLCCQRPDFVLHPMARAFPLSDAMQAIWDKSEFPEYLAEYCKLHADILVCNALGSVPDDDNVYCGGAWLIQGNRVIDSLPLLQEGLLVVDLNDKNPSWH